MTLDRRAFLRLATKGRERVLEVACERLYVRWVDAPAQATPLVVAEAMGGWMEEPGEPPTHVALQTRGELLAQLDATLAGAQALRLVEPEWLADAELRREVEARVAAFRRRGGRLVTASGRARSFALAVLFTLCFAVPAAAQAQASPIPDDVLRARVEAAIEAAADLPADSVTVLVAGGVVTLTGSLLCEACGGNATPGGTGTVQQSLGAVVRAVPGVIDVRFRLTYRPPA
ncbi:MAG: BON domain-containing protein [Gemmatimonadetes bacterium]|nr:BON domain-containing protein [Gemmatimonadota bacterium]